MKLIKNRVLPICLVWMAFAFFSSCQSKPCNIQERSIESADVKAIDAKVAALKKDSTMNTIKIYKPDGSLQCNQGKPISLKDMQAELKDIKVVSSDKQHDGLMRIQVCGQPTGMNNVFEISATDLERAKLFGFKIWKKD